jgi:hypothetical protein
MNKNNIYKDKYLKYKNKFLKLKKIHHVGGDIENVLSMNTNRFNIIYKRYMNSNLNSYIDNKTTFEAFINIYHDSYMHTSDPYDMLIGAKNTDKNDYNRFGFGSDYTLFVDVFNIQTNNIHPKYREKYIFQQQKNITMSIDPEKQYNMYTIFYEDMIKNNIYKIMNETIQNIHFDTGVSYFASNGYLEIAEHMLVVGGKITWDLMQHMSYISLVYNDDDENNFRNRTNGMRYNIDEVQILIGNNNVEIDMDNKTIIKKSNLLFENNKMCPQTYVTIYDEKNNNIPFKNNIYHDFIFHCNEKYKSLSFELKIYTYSDFNYPVPIRKIYINENRQDYRIDVYNRAVNFMVNKIMTFEEKELYTTSKKLSNNEIMRLNNKIHEPENINLYNDLKNMKSLEEIRNNINFDQHVDNLSDMEITYLYFSREFNKEMEYIEATKTSSI